MIRVFLLALLWVLAVACSDDETTGGGGGPVGGAGGQGGDGGTVEPMCPGEATCNTMQRREDTDGDGCADRCCYISCETDFEPADPNNDGCADQCNDKRCTTGDDCEVFMCTFFDDTCGDPRGVCSDLACEAMQGGCGCDGNFYGSACAAAAAGVGIDTTGAACP